MKRGHAIPMTNGGGVKGKLKYAKTAPPYLVYLHKNKKVAIVKLGVMGDLLGELLTHPKMEDVWSRLTNNIGDEIGLWDLLWQEICRSIKGSKNPPNPSDEKLHFEDVSKSAEALATMLERGRGRLNLPAFCFSPTLQSVPRGPQ